MKSLYAVIERLSYSGKLSPGIFEGGFVKQSAHKENTIYLQIPPDFIFELTDDEAMAIIHVLSATLWQKAVPMSSKTKKKFRWVRKETSEI